MKKLIHRLRRHPEHVRIKILYVCMAVSAFLLFSAWSFVTGSTVTNKSTQASISNDLKPFSMLKGSIIDSAKNFSWPSSTNTNTNTNTNSTDTTTPPLDSTNTASNNMTSTTPDNVATPDTTNDAEGFNNTTNDTDDSNDTTSQYIINPNQ